MVILTTSEFTKFYQTTYKVAKKGPWLVHYTLGTPEAKIGLSVSKKVFKRAVKRNKTKRYLKEWLRHEVIPQGNYNIILNKSLDFTPVELLKVKSELLALLQGLK
jgi:ribonuclease P protein component